ncbi:MAG: hypothetical protein RI953_1967, partial [Pseudomonadota bacterium]
MLSRNLLNHWRNLVVVALVMAVSAISSLTSCSGGVKQGGNLGWTVDIVAGAKQVALPKRPFANPIEIFVKDPTGNPVIDASVEFRLVDEALIGKENITPDVLAKAWNTESAAQTSSDSAVRTAAIAAAKAAGKDAKKAEADIEERVGRIDQFEQRTDRLGRAKVWVIAPVMFNRTIAVLAKAGSDISQSYSYAILATPDLKDGSNLFVDTTGNKKEAAGAEFDITITIVDSEGRIASSFEGLKKMKLEAAPSTSWAGFAPEFPTGEFDCQFSGGRCLVPRGPYKLRVPEKVNFKLSFTDDSVNPIEDFINVTPTNEKAFIALKKSAGPPTADTPIITKINIPTGDEVNLSAAYIDSNGNFIDDVANPTWDIPDSTVRLKPGLTSLTGTSVIFRPTKTGSGNLTVKSENFSLLKDIPVTVPAGAQTEWRFRFDGKESIVDTTDNISQRNKDPIPTGTCVDIDLYASDKYGNIVTVPEIKSVSLEILDAEDVALDSTEPDSLRVLFDDARIGDVKGRKNRSYAASLERNDEGVASKFEKVCFYDALKLPKLKVTANNGKTSFTSTTNVRLKKNDGHRLMLVKAGDAAGSGDNARSVCTRSTTENPVGLETNRCLVHEVGETQSFKVVVVDVAGNFISNVKSSLYLASASESNLLSSKLTPDSAAFETPTAPGVLGAGPAVRNADTAHTLKFNK